MKDCRNKMVLSLFPQIHFITFFFLSVNWIALDCYCLPPHIYRNTKYSQDQTMIPLRYKQQSFLPTQIRQYMVNVRGGGGGGGEGEGEGEQERETMNNSNIDLYDEEVFFHHENPPNPFIEIPDFPKMDHSFLESSTNDSSKNLPKVGLIFMDNFSPYHGQYLSYMARKAYNVGVVNVLSGYMIQYLAKKEEEQTLKEDNDDNSEHETFDYPSMRVPDIGKEKEWAKQIPFDIVGIICESDSGLASAERLGMALGLYPKRHDGINRARRDKFLMNQAMKKHGLYSIQQKLCSTLDEAIDFAQNVCHIKTLSNKDTMNHNADLQDIPCVVVKPSRGVASDNVHLCTTIEEIQNAFSKIHHTPIFGSPSKLFSHVLVQEFARGTEYAIDIVSRNGQHKVAALWKYDKRSVNDAPFVYHATMLVDPTSQNMIDSKEGMEACTYAMKALDALGLKWGLSHVEVMVNSKEDRTCLIEVNCRQHNTDFAPMTSMCIGYNALDMLLSAYLGDCVEENDKNIMPMEEAALRMEWDSIPIFPSTRLCGAIIHLVCHAEGVVKNIQGLEELENLESVQHYEIYPSFLEGNKVSKTIDIRTDAGWVHLINDDCDQFWRDYNRIMELMKNMFVVEN